MMGKKNKKPAVEVDWGKLIPILIGLALGFGGILYYFTVVKG